MRSLAVFDKPAGDDAACNAAGDAAAPSAAATYETTSETKEITMTFFTCDLCDIHEDKLLSGALSVLPPVFQCFGKRSHFYGIAATLKVFEDNVMVRAALEKPGDGRVLVIDGGASLRCALVGGNLAQLAEKNGWAGVIVDGCVRDLSELGVTDIGIRALGVHPRRSVRRGVGDADLAVLIAGVMVRPGDWIYADADGVLISREPLHL